MNNTVIGYLKSLINQKKYNVGIDFFDSFINSGSAMAGEGCHERFLVKFAKSRSERRYLSVNGRKDVYGFYELMDNLNGIRDEEYIESYNLSNNEFVGTCFVYNDFIVGFEFVRRGGAFSVEGLVDF